MSRHSSAREAREPVDPRGMHLRLDPSVCDGVGICSHLAPDLVAVDTWGYPIIATVPLTEKADRRQAEAAVTGCPRKALSIS